MPREPLTDDQEMAQGVAMAIAWVNRAIRKGAAQSPPALARTHLYVALTALHDAAAILPPDPLDAPLSVSAESSDPVPENGAAHA